MDAFQLYQQLDVLQYNYMHLAMLLHRVGKHKESHRAWAKHDAFCAVMNDLFPFRDGGGKSLNSEFRCVQRELAELEERIEGGA